jgi:hypothetical protein
MGRTAPAGADRHAGYARVCTGAAWRDGGVAREAAGDVESARMCEGQSIVSDYLFGVVVMSGVPPIGAPDSEADERRSGGLRDKLLSPKTVIGLVIVALAVWFVLANNSQTRIHLWVAWVTAKLWIVLAVTFAAGVLSGLLIRRRGGRDRDRRRD